MHDSAQIANRFLKLSDEQNKTLTPMQLLKLVYIAHGWSLGLYGTPLIKDEVQAWQYGPVIPKLYNKIRHHRSAPVSGPLHHSDSVELSDREINVIDQVFDIYGDMTGASLSRITHAAGTPWEQTYTDGSFGLEISSDLIQDHYNRLASKAA